MIDEVEKFSIAKMISAERFPNAIIQTQIKCYDVYESTRIIYDGKIHKYYGPPDIAARSFLLEMGKV